MQPEKLWRKRESNSALAEKFQRELGVSDICAQILTARSLTSSEEAREFLEPSLKKLLEPFLFADMQQATNRIVRAILSRERIGIFGDYDVDGVTATAVLEEFLLSVGGDAISTLPHRMTEGYGLSRPGIERLDAQGAQLLITVDCGILAHENVLYAKSLGFDVIIVDHHTVGPTLPDALAVINPKRLDCGSNAHHLCAAGVSFYLCMAIRRELRGLGYFFDKPEPDLKHLLDLVALATVCDVVPLVKDNRALVRAGLRMLKEGRRVGLHALMLAAGVEQQKISSTNLGFHLGPRINAAGRLEDATIALKLMLASDPSRAHELALCLNDHNQDRRAIEDSTVEEVCAMIEADSGMKNAKALVLHDEDWHPGVVGIIASRIAERYHRPTIVIGKNGKGSGRSIKGVDLHEMVSKAQESLAGFGGHAHAIGLTLGPLGVARFRNDLLQVMAHAIPDHVYTPELLYDTEVPLKKITFALVEELARLEPFGAHNPYPVLRINQVFLRNLRRLQGGHIKGELESSNGCISFIGFRMNIDDDFAHHALDVLGVIEKNEWQGRVSLQLRLIDLKRLLKQPL